MKKSSLFIMAVLFIGMISINLFAQPEREMRMERFKNKIADKLNLTDEQNNSIESLKLQHQKAMVGLRSEEKLKEIELRELKFKGNYSREEFISKVKEINEIRNKIAVSQAEHKMDVYGLLTDDQKLIWNKMPDRFGEHRKDMMKQQMKLHKDF